MVSILPSLQLRRRGPSAPPPSLTTQIQNMLAGTTGFAFDPTDATTMWQEDTKVTPAVSGQPVGAVRTKFGNTQFDLLQVTPAARPIWDGTRFLTFDGVDDRLSCGSVPILMNASGYYLAARQSGITTTVINNIRLTVQGLTGRMRVITRRLDADAPPTFTGLNGSVMSGSTIAYSQDLAVDGTGIVYSDNNFIENLRPLAGPFGNSKNTNLPAMFLMNNGGGAFALGSLGRMIMLPFIPSTGQRNTIQSWLTEV